MAAKMFILFMAAFICKVQSQYSCGLQETINPGLSIPQGFGPLPGPPNVPSSQPFLIPHTEFLISPKLTLPSGTSSSAPCNTANLATLPCNTPCFTTSFDSSTSNPCASALSIATPAAISSTIIDNTVANSLAEAMQLMVVNDLVEDLNSLIASTSSIVNSLSSCTPSYSSVDVVPNISNRGFVDLRGSVNSCNKPYGVNSNLYGASSSLLDQSCINPVVSSPCLSDVNSLTPNTLAFSEVDSLASLSSSGPRQRSSVSEVSSLSSISSLGSNARPNFNGNLVNPVVSSPCLSGVNSLTPNTLAFSEVDSLASISSYSPSQRSSVSEANSLSSISSLGSSARSNFNGNLVNPVVSSPYLSGVNSLTPNTLAFSGVDSLASISSYGPSQRSSVSEASSLSSISSLGSNARSNFNGNLVNPVVSSPCLTGVNSLTPNTLAFSEVDSLASISSYGPSQRSSVSEASSLSSISSLGSNAPSNFNGNLQEVVYPRVSNVCGYGGNQEVINSYAPKLNILTEISSLSFPPSGSNSLASIQETINPLGSYGCRQEQPNLYGCPQVNFCEAVSQFGNPLYVQEVNYPRVPNHRYLEENLVPCNIYANQGSFSSVSNGPNIANQATSTSVISEVSTEAAVTVNSNPYDNIQDGTSVSTNTLVATEVDTSGPNTSNALEEVAAKTEVAEVVALPSPTLCYSEVVANTPTIAPSYCPEFNSPVTPSILVPAPFSPLVAELVIPSSIPAQLSCNLVSNVGRPNCGVFF